MTSLVHPEDVRTCQCRQATGPSSRAPSRRQGHRRNARGRRSGPPAVLARRALRDSVARLGEGLRFRSVPEPLEGAYSVAPGREGARPRRCQPNRNQRLLCGLPGSWRPLSPSGTGSSSYLSPEFESPVPRIWHGLQPNASRNGPSVRRSGDPSLIAKTTSAKWPALSSSAARKSRAVRTGSLPKAPQPQAPSARVS